MQRHIARFHGRSARIYTPGHAAAVHLRELGLTEVEVWGRGVDINRFHPSHRDRSVLTPHRIAPDDFVFLHVGRLAAEKGFERILDAYRIAKEQLEGQRTIHLIVAGDGPRATDLRKAAPQSVTFLGNLDRATMLPRLYSSADAFVFASHTETLGLVILEAMASGLPVIARCSTIRATCGAPDPVFGGLRCLFAARCGCSRWSSWAPVARRQSRILSTH